MSSLTCQNGPNRPTSTGKNALRWPGTSRQWRGTGTLTRWTFLQRADFCLINCDGCSTMTLMTPVVVQENLATTYWQGAPCDRTAWIGEPGNPGGGSARRTAPVGPAGRAAPADRSSA